MSFFRKSYLFFIQSLGRIHPDLLEKSTEQTGSFRLCTTPIPVCCDRYTPDDEHPGWIYLKKVAFLFITRQGIVLSSHRFQEIPHAVSISTGNSAPKPKRSNASINSSRACRAPRIIDQPTRLGRPHQSARARVSALALLMFRHCSRMMSVISRTSGLNLYSSRNPIYIGTLHSR